MTRTYEQLNSVKFEKQQNIERFFNDRLNEAKIISNYNNWVKILNVLALFNDGKTPEKIIKSSITEEYNLHLKKILDNGCYTSADIQWQDLKINLNISDKFNEQNIEFSKICRKEKTTYEINASDDIKFIESGINKDILIEIPIKKDSSEKIFIKIFLKINMSVVNTMMFNTNKMNGLGETGEAYIVGDDLLMKTTSRFKENSANKIQVNTAGVQSALKNISGTNEYPDYRGIKVMGAYGKLNITGLNWVITAEIDTHEAMIPIYTLRNSIIILAIIISLLLFGIVLIISRRISSPVIKLKQAAGYISKGNYDVFLEKTSDDEIGELTMAFNEMAAKIKQQTKDLYDERSKRMTSVYDGQEQERQRLARELHDGLGQRILAIKMQLERLDNADAGLKQKLIDDAKKMLASVSKEVVSMSENLMPQVLSEFGLISAIENLCEESRNINGIKINFNYNQIPTNCSRDIKTYTYRIIQEALTNIVKHSEANHAEINLTFENNIINLSIADDGKGFDKNNIRSGANGINNIRSRTEILGGGFDIKSSPGNGTVLNIFLETNNNTNFDTK
ncbi:MAG TPA: histidine kinase [Bacteroidales bacterium]|nr:histidine kinase [Bacteroidales bacterium]